MKERKIAAIALVLLLLAGGLAAALFLPQASIRLVLQTAPLLVDQTIQVQQAGAGGADTVEGLVFVQEVRIQGTSPVVSTESVGTKARGTVQIINRTLEEQSIRENSRLVTKDGILFYMQKHVIVPPATPSSPSAVTVIVEAAEPGADGNIEPQRLDFAALDSSAQSVVYAETAAPITGGAGEEVLVVQEADLEQARTAAGTAAKQKVETQVLSELPQGWNVLDESFTTEVTAFESGAKIGERAEVMAYTASVTVRVMGYEENTLEEILKKALESKLDEDYMLFPGPISFTKSVDSIDWEEKTGTFTARVTHTTIPRFSLETLQAKLAGRSQEEAQQYLEGLSGVESASIELWPFWVRTIPRLEKRIRIDLVSNRQP